MNTRTAPAAAPQHHDAELTLSSSKKPGPDQAAAQRKKNDDLARVATEMRERNAAGAQDPEAEAAPLPEPREDIESIEVQLLDKRMVVFGPPRGVSLTMRIAMTIPEATTNPVIDRLARVIMSVRTLAGAPMRPVSNIIDLTRNANEVGDTGIDELHFWFEKYWGNLRVSDAQVLKKNLRG